MSFNFDEPLNRRDSDSAKWNLYPADVLPMWVADMDFKSPEPIVQALRDRVEHAVYGYSFPSKKMSEIIAAWCLKRYNWTISPDDVVMLPGLVSGLNIVCRAFGNLGDSTITLTPVYPPIISSSAEQGMTSINAPLVPVYDGHTLRYEIDFDAFEKAITPRTGILMMCHPHNPTGREFTRDEMLKLGEICIRKNLLICSDEIHCDLLLDGSKHTPFASISKEIADRTITLMAPSKTFNVPGLGSSFAIIQNAQLRQRMTSAKSGLIPYVNLMGLTATAAAFTSCDDWLLALGAYLTENRNTMVEYIKTNMPGIKTTVAEATYLAFFDCKESGIEGDHYTHFLNKAKVATNAGPNFGKGGEGFVRFNFGCPRAQMLEALEKMAESLPV